MRSLTRSMIRFLSGILSQGIGYSHELVDDDQGNPETRAQHNDLLHNRFTKGGRTLRVLVKDFRHGHVGEYVADSFDDIRVDGPD